MATIFTVDDDRDIMKVYREILLMRDHKIVAEALDGQEAVETFRAMKKCPDIIIMDHRMPGKNGLEAMKDIRNINPMQGIIFVTADQEAAKKAMAMGANSFILKPFRMDALFNSIELTISDMSERNNRLRESLLGIVTRIGSEGYDKMSISDIVEKELIDKFLTGNSKIPIEKSICQKNICGFFNMVSMDFSWITAGKVFKLINKKCHWMETLGPNPNFCFVTKCIISRFAKRTGSKFTLDTKQVIMDGSNECVFELVFH